MKLKDRRLAFVDVETTGLDPSIHEIIEFSVLFLDRSMDLSFKIKPQHIETAHPKALEVNGYAPEKWEGAYTPQFAAELIGPKLKKCILVGQNINFDVGFIRALLKQEGNDTLIDRRNIDTMVLALEHLVPCGLRDASLKGICLFLGIEPEPAEHRAENGALAALRVYNALCRAGWWKRLWWRWRNRKG